MWRSAPFVGRSVVLDRLGELIDRARSPQPDGRPTGILIEGDAGIGKTCLLDELVRIARTRGVEVRSVVATQSSASVPLGCLSDVLKARHLSAPAPPDAIFHEAVAGLVAEAQAGAWLLAVDDLPNVDRRSAAAIHQCLIVTGAPFVATARTGAERPDAFDALWRHGDLEVITLVAMDDADMHQLAAAAFGGRLTNDSRLRVVALAQGNPLLLREMLAGAEASHALLSTGDEIRLRDGFHVSTPVVDVVRRRLATLSAAEMRALQLVALAEPVELADLQQLVDDESVDELLQRGLVVIIGASRSARLAHPLFGEVMRSQLSPARRRRLAADLLAIQESASVGIAPDALRRARLSLEIGQQADVATLAAGAIAALHSGDRAFALQLVAAALSNVSALHRPASDGDAKAVAAAFLADALIRADVRDRAASQRFERALDAAHDDPDRLAVMHEWSWWALFAAGSDAALEVVLQCEADLRSSSARRAAEVHRSMIVGFSGRWSEAGDRALRLHHDEVDDPPALRLGISTVLAMAGAYDGPAALARWHGDRAQADFVSHAVIPAAQAVCATVGSLFGTMQIDGIDDGIRAARDLVRRSHNGELYVDYAGTWHGVVANNAVCFGALTRETLHDAEEAVRLLSMSDPCGVLSFAVSARGLFAALANDLPTASEFLDRYDSHLRAVEAKTTVLADRGRAWLAFQRGDVERAVSNAEAAWEAAWERSDVATFAITAAHDLARFGFVDRALDRIEAAARRLDSPFSAALLRHARAIDSDDASQLVAAAQDLAALGANGIAAEALAAATRLTSATSVDDWRLEAATLLRGSLIDTPILRSYITGALTATSAAVPRMRLDRVGSGWVVTYGGTTVRLRSMIGLSHLAVLLGNPGADIKASRLVSGDVLPTSSDQALLDPTARRSLERRARQILSELTAARATDDDDTVAQLEAEAASIAAELTASTGQRGRSRAFSSPDERSRTAVQKAIARAIALIGEESPPAAAYLASRVSTGRTCRFQP